MSPYEIPSASNSEVMADPAASSPTRPTIVTSFPRTASQDATFAPAPPP